MEGQLRLSELSLQIKQTLQGAFEEQIWVVAEIAELKVNRTGHCYLELVEKNDLTDEVLARMRATIWSWQFRFIRPYFESSTGQTLQAGIKVLVAVSVEFHEVYGFSLNIKDIDPTYTLGDMAKKRQQIIDQLHEEGVFEMNKELELAEIPSRIAIISSPTAAGYEDFINQLSNNLAGFQFYTKLFPAYMQGNEAVSSMLAALDAVYSYEDAFDVVVIIRGGGAQMDLNCFDNYELALNITQFPLPVLTGIGHEKDETIADLVAHTKLKTPTAVAEFLIGKMDEVASKIQEYENLLFDLIETILDNESNRIANALRLLKPLVNSRFEKANSKLNQLASQVKPIVSSQLENERFSLRRFSHDVEYSSLKCLQQSKNRLKDYQHKMTLLSKIHTEKSEHFIFELQHKLPLLVNAKLQAERDRVEWFDKNVNLLDPKNILKRGYSITLKDGKAVKSATQLNNNDELEHLFYQGKVKSIVKK